MICPSHKRRGYEMANKRSHYEDISIRGKKNRVHLGDNFSELFASKWPAELLETQGDQV